MKDLTTFLDQQKPGFSLSQRFYTHQQIFDLEWQHIWKKYWLFAGTTAEIPKPGDNRGLAEASGSERAICIHGGEFFREPEATGFGREGKYHFRKEAPAPAPRVRNVLTSQPGEWKVRHER